MSDSGAIDDGLFALLRGDATLAAIVTGGWYLDEAPESAGSVFGIVKVQAAPDHNVLGGRAMEEVHYEVKVVSRGTTGGSARTGASRVDTLLTESPIVATGYTHMSTQRTSSIRYPERDGEVVWQHRGGIYEVWMNRN